MPSDITLSESDVKRFWAKVDRSGGPNACWPYMGKRKQGYGRWSLGGKWHYAHRIAFLIHYGKLPQPCGCHACDNPPCCNPAHLWEGTRRENTHDMIAKGRDFRGDNSGKNRSRGKINVDDVKAIRLACQSGEPQLSVARRYGISQSNVSLIVIRKTWGSVE